MSGPIFKRIAESAIRHLGIRPSINAAPPVLVARRDVSGFAPSATAGVQGEPTVSLVSDGPPGTIPDLRGLSAREAVRALGRIGLVARMTGDGFVISQDPPPGEPVEQGMVCAMVLGRSAQ